MESKVIPTAAEYVQEFARQRYVHIYKLTVEEAAQAASEYASLAVEQAKEAIKEDVMVTLLEVLNDSHIFESEYQNLRKKMLKILNNGK